MQEIMIMEFLGLAIIMVDGKQKIYLEWPKVPSETSHHLDF